jgi:hypothetical protein
LPGGVALDRFDGEAGELVGNLHRVPFAADFALAVDPGLRRRR